MTDRDLLELIAAQVGKLTTQVDGLTTQVGKLTVDVEEIKKIVVRIENDHGQKLGALLDGYRLLSERMDRHEEIITRKY
ncbi:MAG: hypothetical protein GX044_03395 [Firmicutes bacterium]|jgi:hypothetical protein|nr:hypothetical protein [Bacillota bacterium]